MAAVNPGTGTGAMGSIDRPPPYDADAMAVGIPGWAYAGIAVGYPGTALPGETGAA